MIKKLFPWLFRKNLGSIVAPLNKIADELAALESRNDSDNALDRDAILYLEHNISDRNIESQAAHSIQAKIRDLLH